MARKQLQLMTVGEGRYFKKWLDHRLGRRGAPNAKNEDVSEAKAQDIRVYVDGALHEAREFRVRL